MINIKVGRTYRGKSPGYTKGYVNDRTVVWFSNVLGELQYDGPAVGIGRKYPAISIREFIAWAEHDITDQLPAGEYQQWGDYLVQLQNRRKELKPCRAKRTKQPGKLTVEKTSAFVKHTGTV